MGHLFLSPHALAPGTYQSLTSDIWPCGVRKPTFSPSALRSTTWDLRQVLGVGGGVGGAGARHQGPLGLGLPFPEQEASRCSDLGFPLPEPHGSY